MHNELFSLLYMTTSFEVATIHTSALIILRNFKLNNFVKFSDHIYKKLLNSALLSSDKSMLY